MIKFIFNIWKWICVLVCLYIIDVIIFVKILILFKNICDKCVEIWFEFGMSLKGSNWKFLGCLFYYFSVISLYNVGRVYYVGIICGEVLFYINCIILL